MGRSKSAEEEPGYAWSSQVDAAWQSCILSLDGGGVRSYSSLLILKALMHEIWMWENRLADEHEDAVLEDIPSAENRRIIPPTGNAVPDEEDLLPCHYFDFVYGTSSGGLIATMLGRLRMTMKESITAFHSVMDAMLSSPAKVLSITKYDHRPMESALRLLVSSKCQVHSACVGEDAFQRHADPVTVFDVDQPRVTQTACLASTHNGGRRAYLLRSYPLYYTDDTPAWLTRYNEGCTSVSILKVIRATSAAPFYFKAMEMEIDGHVEKFRDGGIMENNPVSAAYSEFRALESEIGNKTPALLLSVGTGIRDEHRDENRYAFAGALFGLAWLFIFWFTGDINLTEHLGRIEHKNDERAHLQMRNLAEGETTWYKRLNVKSANLPQFDDWVAETVNGRRFPGIATWARIEQLTAQYLSADLHRITLRHTAEKLVRQRRARESLGGPRWEVFASGKEAATTDGKAAPDSGPSRRAGQQRTE